jgi:hypothetical protein
MAKRIPKQEPEIDPKWALEQQAALHREVVTRLIEELHQLERIVACYRRDAELRMIERIESGE